METVARPSTRLFGWWHDADRDAHRALVAASLGWLLDAFDVMLYAFVLSSIIADFGMTRATAGLLGSVTLVASALGGLAFGVVADKVGRTRALIASILIYSVFTAACGFAQTVWQLAAFRIGLGLGMGGEWASGAALVAESWPAAHRGKALGLVQSAWAVGHALAALVTALVLPRWGWRAVFFVGILPALVTIWIRRGVREPAVWQRSRAIAAGTSGRWRRIFGAEYRTVTLALTLMNACTLFAYWGFNLWVPAYLTLPPSDGGLGLGIAGMSMLVAAMQVGTWFGYVAFGFASDVFGRKRTYVSYLLTASVLMLAFAWVTSPLALLLLGPATAFFGTGSFSGFGAVTAEIYATDIRASAQGLTYNLGRIVSAAAPFVVGGLSSTHGFGVAFAVVAMAFLVAASLWLSIPETRGRSLAA
jgi:MFS family permease